MSADVVHNTAIGRFEITVEDIVSVLDYSQSGQTITFVHTGVPAELEGRGIGSQLARAGLEYAVRENLHVVPRCPFIRTYIERHPEYPGPGEVTPGHNPTDLGYTAPMSLILRSQVAFIPVLLTVLVAAAVGVHAIVQERERSQVPDRYKWDLTALYPSDEAWRQAKDRVAAQLPGLQQ